jgi:hypothetical protein
MTLTRNAPSAEELKELFIESGFIYPAKLANLDLDMAVNNIVASYVIGNNHLHYVERENGKLVAHLALLRLHGKFWMGHHHCTLTRHGGVRVFIRFAEWVANNYNTQIQHLYAFYRRNSSFYDKIYKSVGNNRLCSIKQVGFDPNEIRDDYHGSDAYGLNLSHLHVRTAHDNLKDHHDVYYRWYFRCTKNAIDASFNFFNTLR